MYIDEKIIIPIDYIHPLLKIYPSTILPFHIINTSVYSKHWNYYNDDDLTLNLYKKYTTKEQRKDFVVCLLKRLNRNFIIKKDYIYDYGYIDNNSSFIIPYKFNNNKLINERGISEKCFFLLTDNINFEKYNNNNLLKYYKPNIISSSFEDFKNYHIERISSISLCLANDLLLYLKNGKY